MDRLRALRYFVEAAEMASFSRAAEMLGVPASSVSRRILDLERELGVALFHRSTRVVKLTELGALYLEQVKPAIAALGLADELVGQQSQTRIEHGHGRFVARSLDSQNTHARHLCLFVARHLECAARLPQSGGLSSIVEV